MQSRALARLALAALIALAPAVNAEVQFSDAEIKAILAHGPWPAPSATDPTNPVSGKREAIELGERLFFDERLSAAGRFSCGSCHIPARNWTDNRTRGAAIAEVGRNTLTLMNLRLARQFGWDGATDALWRQSLRPMLDARELGSSPRHIAERVRKDGELSCRYRKTFGDAPSPADDEAVLADVGRALAALIETFETPPTPFDRFRNALARSRPAGPGPKWRLQGADAAPPASYGTLWPPRRGRDARRRCAALLGARLARNRPLKLSAAEQSDLVVFLESISTFNNPWRPEDPGRCQ